MGFQSKMEDGESMVDTTMTSSWLGKMMCYWHSCTCPNIWAMVGCKSMHYSFVKDPKLSNEH
jgi:hypothetical protein